MEYEFTLPSVHKSLDRGSMLGGTLPTLRLAMRLKDRGRRVRLVLARVKKE